MRAELANLNYCAVPFLSRAAANLSWYDSSTSNRIRVVTKYGVVTIYGVVQNKVSVDKIRCSTKTWFFTDLNKIWFNNNLRFRKTMSS